MAFFTITFLINFATSIFLGSFVFFKNTKNLTNRSYLFFNLSIAFYSICCFFWQMSGDFDVASFLWKIFTIAIIIINISFFYFISIFTNILKLRSKVLFLYFGVSIFFVLLNLGSFFYDKFEMRFGIGIWPEPTFIFNAYLVFWILQCIHSFYYLIYSLKKTTGVRKEQMKYLTLAAFLAFAGGGTNWLIIYKVDISPYIGYTNLLVSLYVVLVAYAIIKYNFLNIKIVLSRATIFVMVYACILGIPMYFGVKEGYNPLFLLSIFSLATISPVIYRFLQGKAENLLLADQKHHHQILFQASKDFLKEHDLNKLLKLMVTGIKDVMQIDLVDVFLINEKDSLYDFIPMEPQIFFPDDFSLSFDHPVIDFIKEKKEPLFFEEIKNYFKEIRNNPVHLLIPAMVDDQLLAVFVLGEKMDRSIYTVEDLQVFATLSNQAALAIQNSFIIEKNKRVLMELSRAEKFSFIGGIAEGAAHQIRNRLSCFSLAAAEIRLKIDDYYERSLEQVSQTNQLEDIFDSIKETSGYIIDNVSKTDSVVKGIISYSETNPGDSSFALLRFKELIEEVVNLIEIKYLIRDFNLKLKISARDTLMGVKLELIEVLYTLLENCCESILEKKDYILREPDKSEPNFIPSLKVEFSKEKKFDLIKITDNGMGIEKHNKDKIFAPFFTTKASFKTKSGFGSVLYIAKKIIEINHGGEIWFESTPLKETTFFIKLPSSDLN